MASNDNPFLLDENEDTASSAGPPDTSFSNPFLVDEENPGLSKSNKRMSIAEALGLNALSAEKQSTPRKVATPQEMAEVRRKMRSGLGIGAFAADEILLNAPSQFSPGFKGALDYVEKESPGTKDLGETLGIVGSMSKKTPAGFIADKALGAASRLPWGKIPEGAGYLRSMIGEGIKGAFGAGLGSATTQAAREAPESIMEGGISQAQLDRVSDAGTMGFGLGGAIGSGLGALKRGFDPVARFDRAIPQEADEAFASGVVKAGKKRNLPLYANKQDPSQTKAIIEEGLPGLNTRDATSRANQRLNDIEEIEFKPLLQRLDQNPANQRTGQQLKDEFLASDKYKQVIKDIEDSGSDAKSQVEWALNTYFETDPSETYVQQIFTPSKVNEQKRRLYNQLADKDFSEESQAVKKRIFRQMSKFFKEKVEEFGDGTDIAGEVKRLNSRSAAMQNYKMRLKEANPQKFTQMARSAVGTGVLSASVPALAGVPYPVAAGLGAAGGLAGAIGSYVAQNPAVGTYSATALNRINKLTGKEKSEAILRLLSAASGRQEE